MKKLFSLAFILVATVFIFAQNRKSHLYKGTIDQMPVTMVIISEDNQCTADLRYTAMYKYDKLSNWLQLNITGDSANQFAMVEYRFTGVMILKKAVNNFQGLWISPDGKRLLKAVFKEVPMTGTEKENYEKRLDEVNYENYDC